ncbi:MAG: MFS transporter [Deltaproteobacteria bacterium]|nr:MFS transporter [Deltaproteobacteria bacterium]
MSRAKSELAVAAWGAATFGALLASYSAFRPVRDALILDGDPDQLPWLFTATFIAVSVVSPLWGAAVAKSPRRVVPIAFHVFAACALAFFAVIRANTAPVTVGRVFYVWSAVFNLFVVSVFWSLLADLLGPGVARKLYGPIAAGGTVGAFVGPLLTKELVGTIGVAGVLVMSAVLLELAVIGTAQLRRVARDVETMEADPPVEGGALDGLKHVARSPYLASIVGYVLCTACAATFVYLAQAKIVHSALPSREDRTDFFSTIDLWVSAVTFVVQLAIAGPLIRIVGPGLVLCVLPLIQGIGIAWLVHAPSLGALAVIAIAGRSATHGLTRPSRELLFTVIPRADKYRAKNVIDTMVYRLGDFGSSWLNKGLAAAGPAVLTLAALPLTLAWLALAAWLGVAFRRRAKETS